MTNAKNAKSISGQGFIIMEVQNGGGRHIGDVDQDTYIKGMHYNFVTQPVYLWAICIVKLAVGLSLLRIAVEKKYRIAIYCVMGLMLFYTFGCFTVSPWIICKGSTDIIQTIMVQCERIAMNWDPTIARSCWSVTTLRGLAYSNQALNLLTDIIFAILIPVPMLWKLQMNKRTKASVIGVLALGMFACIAAIVRIPSQMNYGKVGDLMWDSRDLTIWTVTECNIGIIAGSMPAMKPIFKPLLGNSPYISSFKRRYDFSDQYGNRTTSVRLQDTNPQNFVDVSSNRDRNEDFEAQSQASQEELVGSKSISAGNIEKTVITTVKRGPERSLPQRHGW